MGSSKFVFILWFILTHTVRICTYTCAYTHAYTQTHISTHAHPSRVYSCTQEYICFPSFAHIAWDRLINMNMDERKLLQNKLLRVKVMAFVANGNYICQIISFPFLNILSGCIFMSSESTEFYSCIAVASKPLTINVLYVLVLARLYTLVLLLCA